MNRYNPRKLPKSEDSFARWKIDENIQQTADNPIILERIMINVPTGFLITNPTLLAKLEKKCLVSEIEMTHQKLRKKNITI